MKTLQFTLIIVLLLSVGSLSCKKKNVISTGPTTLPDATFDAQISGAVTGQVKFTLPEQKSDEYSVAGSYISSQGIFLMTAQKLGEKGVSLQASMGNLSTGTHTVSGGTYFDLPSNTSFGILVSGSVKLTKVDFYQKTTGGNLYWVSGSYSLVLSDNNTPPSQITVTCDFSNVLTGKQ